MKEFTAQSWQKITLVLASVLVTGLASWVAFGKDVVTEAEVVHLIQTTAPYTYDREAIKKSIASTDKTLQRVTDLLEKHDREIVRHDERLKSLEKQDG